MSNIEWTTETWNPTVGCSKVSAGCVNCYAIKEAHRLAGNPNPKISDVYRGLTERRGGRTEWTGVVKFLPERLDQILRRKAPTTWFVDSMSDLFHDAVTDADLSRVFKAIQDTPQHTYQILTKRPERMLNVMSRLSGGDDGVVGIDLKRVSSPLVLPNLWLGVSVENQAAADTRIPLLLQTPAAVRFLSCEPLLEEININVEIDNLALLKTTLRESGSSVQVDWVIVGGESGSKARPFDLRWGESLVKQCKAAGISVFVKQLGSDPCIGDDFWKISNSKGNDFSEFPPSLQVRQFPKLTKTLESLNLAEA